MDLREMDPAALIIGSNVRATTREEVEADQAFIASVKAQGVMTPITAYEEGGDVVVLTGQRRTLAALITDTQTVPVIVYPEKPQDVDALREQWDENERRTQMTEADRLSGIEQFTLMGLSAEQIAQTTGESVERVTAAQAVTTSRADMLREHPLTLEQTAVLVEFEDDEQATARLIEAAERGQFDHEAARARWDRECRQAIATARQQYEAQGLNVTEDWPDYDADARVGELRGDEGEELDDEQHQQCPGHTLYLRAARGEDGPEVLADAYCTGWKRHGHHHAWNTSGGRAGGPMTEEEKEQRREVIRLNKEWDAAAGVRREFITALADRKTPPAGAPALIAKWVTDPMAPRLLSATEAAALLDRPKFAQEVTAARTTAARRTALTVAHLVISWEASTSRQTWRSPGGWSRHMMQLLDGWGYTLSEVEQIVAD